MATIRRQNKPPNILDIPTRLYFHLAVHYAIICNRREGAKSGWNEELRKAVDTALEKVAADLK